MRLRRITVAVALATAVAVTAVPNVAAAAGKIPAGGGVQTYGKTPATAGKIPVPAVGKVPVANGKTPKSNGTTPGSATTFGKTPMSNGTVGPIGARGKINGKPGKPAKAKFAASGTVTAVDAAAGTVTVKVKGGTRDVRNKTVTFTVASGARVRVNSRTATLADLAAGFRVELVGTVAGSVWTASRVEARGAKANPAPTTPTPAPTKPTPSPSPTVTPSPEPTETPEPEETPDA